MTAGNQSPAYATQACSSRLASGVTTNIQSALSRLGLASRGFQPPALAAALVAASESATFIRAVRTPIAISTTLKRSLRCGEACATEKSGLRPCAKMPPPLFPLPFCQAPAAALRLACSAVRKPYYNEAHVGADLNGSKRLLRRGTRSPLRAHDFLPSHSPLSKTGGSGRRVAVVQLPQANPHRRHGEGARHA